MLSNVFSDFHIHIGRTEKGEAVKITAARNMTFANIADECVNRKGIQMIGIVDCASPIVINDIKLLLEKGSIFELSEGGYRFAEKLTILLGSEVETKEIKGQAHCLCFFPTLEKIQSFSYYLSNHMTNVNLSSQQCGLSMQQLLPVVKSLGGILIPAHIFTPFKSIYGRCAESLSELFDENSVKEIKAVELGLSSDSYYADYLTELSEMTYLTNSDAHSLPNIGREYNLLNIAKPSYKEFILAITREKGRSIVKNYGLDPKLGKYHRTFCESCGVMAVLEPPILTCVNCGEKNRVTVGVLDRLYQIKSTDTPPLQPKHRPPYTYQVPLRFLPKVGPKTIEKLLSRFGTEMQVLHETSLEEIANLSPQIAEFICMARQGTLELTPGGGGIYGKVRHHNEEDKK